jgi:hypothetical protein
VFVGAALAEPAAQRRVVRRTGMSDWESYDPSWLVELARLQVPGEPWLPAALAHCCRAWKESPAYTYFVSPHRQNLPGSEWQFDFNIVLEHPTEGDLVLDILKDRRVGGVEFISKIERGDA